MLSLYNLFEFKIEKLFNKTMKKNFFGFGKPKEEDPKTIFIDCITSIPLIVESKIFENWKQINVQIQFTNKANTPMDLDKHIKIHNYFILENGRKRSVKLDKRAESDIAVASGLIKVILLSGEVGQPQHINSITINLSNDGTLHTNFK